MTRKKDRDGTGWSGSLLRGIGLARSLEVNLCLNRETDQGDNRKTLSKDYPRSKEGIEDICGGLPDPRSIKATDRF